MAKSNNTPLIIGAVAAVAVIGMGGFLFIQSQKSKDPDFKTQVEYQGGVTEAEAAARIAEANAKVKQAQIEADTQRKAIEASKKSSSEIALTGLMDGLKIAADKLL